MHTLIISVALAMQAWMGMGMESGERTCEVRGSLATWCLSGRGRCKTKRWEI